MRKNDDELQRLLDGKYAQYAKPDFIDSDPLQIPKAFTKKEDIEIAGFIAATIAWGQRKTIIANARKFIELMDNAPHDFVLNHAPKDRLRWRGFVHRTFSELDAMYFLEVLQTLYLEAEGLEGAFLRKQGVSAKERITHFHHAFFQTEHLPRTRKHVSNPEKGSSAKRLNMFLRWMVRPSNEQVDFGIWKNISPAELMMPLDVHTGNVARRLGLLHRKQNDWKAVDELTSRLRDFDASDPVKYDFALFGMGVFE